VIRRFEWDRDKARENLRKHGVSFEEGTTAFSDPVQMNRYDPRHSTDEDRFITIGMSDRQRLLVIIHLDSDTVIRIISVRKATRFEIKTYEEEPRRS
jgi:uncharacterized DUF497 family protein